MPSYKSYVISNIDQLTSRNVNKHSIQVVLGLLLIDGDTLIMNQDYAIY